jgi:hypothetical protein
MNKSAKKHLYYSLGFSIIGIVILASTALYLSGNFKSLTSPFGSDVGKPKASGEQPNVNSFFEDSFTADKINIAEGAWGLYKAPDNNNVKVTESATNGLSVSIQSDKDNPVVKRGGVAFRKTLDSHVDFKATAVVYRPIITGPGTANTGIVFYRGSDNVEIARVSWDQYSRSTVTFRVQNLNKVYQVPVVSDVAVLSLARIGDTIRATYKLGNDTSDSSSEITIGEVTNVNLIGPASGRVRFQAGNTSYDSTDKDGRTDLPRPYTYTSTGRYTYASVAWMDRSSKTFSDTFSKNRIGGLWNDYPASNGSIVESTANHLVMKLSKTKTGSDILTRTDAVGNNKNFSLETSVVKPTVTGTGTGAARIAYAMNSGASGANVEWQVSGGISTLVFEVAGKTISKTSPDGDPVQLSMKLTREGTVYTAFYRTDATADWTQLGQTSTAVLSGAGKLRLITNNSAGSGSPAVTVQFMSAAGSIQQ